MNDTKSICLSYQKVNHYQEGVLTKIDSLNFNVGHYILHNCKFATLKKRKEFEKRRSSRKV